MNDRLNFRAWHTKTKGYYYFNIYDLRKYSLDEYDDDDIEQCTGLKDKNGRLIYEGDIVKAFGFTESYILVCRFRGSSFCLEHVDGRPYNFVRSVAPVEVVGNIHENPELMEK